VCTGSLFKQVRKSSVWALCFFEKKGKKLCNFKTPQWADHKLWFIVFLSTLLQSELKVHMGSLFKQVRKSQVWVLCFISLTTPNHSFSIPCNFDFSSVYIRCCHLEVSIIAFIGRGITLDQIMFVMADFCIECSQPLYLRTRKKKRAKHMFCAGSSSRVILSTSMIK